MDDILADHGLTHEGIFFYHISSLLTALSDAVAEPVCIRSDLDANTVCELIYYDAEDRGPDIMKKRYKNAREDIEKFMGYHNQFLQTFTRLDMTNMIDPLFEYVNFIEEHQRTQMDQYFLYFPFCHAGHLEVIEGKIIELSFNPQRNLEEAIEGIECLKATDEIFSYAQTPLDDKYILILRKKISEYKRKTDTTNLLLKNIS